MARRDISDSQRAWLQEELDAWHAQGILSREQTLGILDLYGTPAELAERRRSRAVFTLMVAAAVLVGLAALLLIGVHWAALPSELKLVIILGVVGATHAGGFYLRFRRRDRLSAEAVFFLGCLVYGAGIGLVAEVLHINAHFPDGLWWWALGVLPFALCLDTLLLHVLLVGLLELWAGLEILGFQFVGAWLFGRWPGLPNGAYTLPVLALPGLVWAYKKKSPFTVALYAKLLTWWVVLQPFAWHWGVYSIYFIGSVGSLLLVIAESHPVGSPFAIPYRLYGVLLSAGVLVPLSFYGFNANLVKQFQLQPGIRFEQILQALVIVVLSAVAVVLPSIERPDHSADGPRSFLDRMLASARRLWLPIGLMLFLAFQCWWNIMAPLVAWAALPATILANAGLVACAFWLMHVGLREDRGRPFTAGVALFLLWAVLRYADLFGDFGGVLGAALMFFLCGAALFAVATYWRRRKEVQNV